MSSTLLAKLPLSLSLISAVWPAAEMAITSLLMASRKNYPEFSQSVFTRYLSLYGAVKMACYYADQTMCGMYIAVCGNDNVSPCNTKRNRNWSDGKE